MDKLKKIKLILDTSCVQSNVIGLLRNFNVREDNISRIVDLIEQEQSEIIKVINSETEPPNIY
jgi:hypothetical protein